MKIKIQIVFICFCLISGCKHSGSNNIQIEGAEHIVVHPESYQDKIHYSQLFDTVRYVKLETQDDILLASIAKIQFFKTNFYILDSRLNILFVFSETGKFIRKIGKIGNGPGEYHRIADFDLNNDRIYLFDPNRNILEYDLSGNYIENHPLRRMGTSIAVNHSFFYVSTCNFPSEEGNYQLLIMNNYGKDFCGGIPLKQEKLIGACKVYETGNAFCAYNNETLFFSPFSTIIYSITRDSIYAKYNIDFGDVNIPNDFFYNYTIDDLKDRPYAYGLNSFWENDICFSFNLRVKDQFKNACYFKNEKKIVIGDFYDDIAFCFPNLLTSNNDFALGFRFADELHDEYDHVKEKENNVMLKHIVSEIMPDDNPVVFLYYFKN